MKVVDKIVENLVCDGTIEADDRELYAYGLNQGIIMLINISLTIGIGILLQMFLETIVFMLVYMPLRSFAGGVHAKTQTRCFIYSMLLVVGVLLAIKYFPVNEILIIAAAAVSSAIIFVLAPVEDLNKPIDDVERKIYGGKARRILGICFGSMILLLFLPFGMILKKFAITIMITLLMLSVALILGIRKNKILRSKGV
ncbi:accessory gene regulator ArgB-like protein [Anaeromicropila populeti]|uniref:Accessory gene regulator B n=1 Tax=Anaeromicropila populeti TaxID=37658 RepID=A0A1I6KKE9_9FIRM|nr:accessory gene regulator B family protein [Anaeromicropila populeti]SFR91735.1 accessory gene regulator B [Anaeromicropila populeti]